MEHGKDSFIGHVLPDDLPLDELGKMAVNFSTLMVSSPFSSLNLTVVFHVMKPFWFHVELSFLLYKFPPTLYSESTRCLSCDFSMAKNKLNFGRTVTWWRHFRGNIPTVKKLGNFTFVCKTYI